MTRSAGCARSCPNAGIHTVKLAPLLRQPWPWLLLALLVLGAGLGLRDPSPPDEPRFVLAARQMVESGDWLLPRRGSELYAHKPPPFMWAQAASYKLVGEWRIAFLLPSLLAALATLWLVQDLGRRLWDRSTGVVALLALLATFQFGLQAQRAQIDMLLVALTTLSLWGLLRHLLLGPNRLALAVGGFAAGLGTVTKGVGFLPLLVLLPAACLPLIARLPAAARRPVKAGSASALFLHAPALPLAAAHAPGSRRLGADVALLALAFVAGTAVWLAPLALAARTDPDPALRAYLQDILLRQTATRYFDAWHHHQPPWYYLEVIATLWLPGALLLPWLLPAWWRRLRRGDRRQLLLLGWVALVLLFFSLSSGKREVYIFPALPALCLAAAPLLRALLRRPAARWTLRGFLLLAGLLLLAAGASGLAGASWAARIAESRGLLPGELDQALRWLLAAGSFGLAAAAFAGGRRIAWAVPGFSLMLFASLGLGLQPALDASSSARRLMQEVRARIGEHTPLGLVGWREQQLLQAVGPVHEFGFERELKEQWTLALRWQQEPAEVEDRWLFAIDRELPDCVERGQAVSMGRANRREWLLLPPAASRGCRVQPALRDHATQLRRNSSAASTSAPSTASRSGVLDRPRR